MESIITINDKVLTYNGHVLIQPYIPPPPPPTSHLIGWWKLQANLNDELGANSLSILTGSATYAAGHLGNAFDFGSGAENSLYCITTSIFEPCFKAQDTPWSIAVWLYSYHTDNRGYITTCNGGTRVGSALELDPGLDNVGNSINGGGVTISGTAFAPNEWHFFVMRYTNDANRPTVFVDNVESTNVTGLYPHFGAGATAYDRIVLGQSASGSAEGRIQHLRIYNKIISTTEINTLWNGGVGM